ncbi:uncharacterized protein LOC126413150 [Schistocerca serialis cubense]|uniref:uncharacterized protein LOC126413150 n=1 Tax=Schistocerca serialis cubense TaxID=2023355 RepID=UPI00214F5106|nr:uncharacterized protein LOC126413150 [Schistocerca serialis cubense]
MSISSSSSCVAAGLYSHWREGRSLLGGCSPRPALTPSFALFRDAGDAEEERDHAIKLTHSLLMRGETLWDIKSLIIVSLSTELTKDSFNDYHPIDYLAGLYLEQQYHSHRDLAGKMFILGDMTESEGPLR